MSQDDPRIIALDPGDATGWATGRIRDGKLDVTASGYGPWKEVGLRLWRAQSSPDPFSHIVYEAWRLRPGHERTFIGSDFPSVQMVGQLKAAAWWAPVDVTLHSQEPHIKPVIDKQMTHLGAGDYLPQSEVEHDRDALRHLHYYALNILKLEVTP